VRRIFDFHFFLLYIYIYGVHYNKPVEHINSSCDIKNLSPLLFSSLLLLNTCHLVTVFPIVFIFIRRGREKKLWLLIIIITGIKIRFHLLNYSRLYRLGRRIESYHSSDSKRSVLMLLLMAVLFVQLLL
jgi:hypothetical protein